MTGPETEILISETRKRIGDLGRRLRYQPGVSPSLRGELYYVAPLIFQYDNERRQLDQLLEKRPFEPRIILRKKKQRESFKNGEDEQPIHLETTND